MFPSEYVRRYARTQVVSAERGALLLLVLEGGQTFLGRARAALEAGDLVRFGEQLGRTEAVIVELLQTLDHDAGGPTATNLALLYKFMLEHLTRANAQRSVQHVDEVRRVYGTILAAYRIALGPGGPGRRAGEGAA